MSRLTPVLLALLLSASATAQEYERVLVPVLTEGVLSGANGATFQTVLSAASPVPAAWYPARAPEGPRNGVITPAFERLEPFSFTPFSVGRLLFIERANAGRVSFSYLLISRGADGSEEARTIPVVREAAFRTGTTWIGGGVTDPIYDGTPEQNVIGYKTRTRLRVYDVDSTGRLSFVVRLKGSGPLSAFQFGEFQVNVNARQADDPTYPMFAELQIPDLCVTAPSGIRCRNTGYVIELEPNDPALRYWAVASITNNVTAETDVRWAQ